MPIINVLSTFMYYLIHPTKTHESFKQNDGEVLRLSVYESLGTSWLFILINGIFKIVLLNFVLIGIMDIVADSEFNSLGLIDFSQIPAYSFLILSAVLDVVFYPLFGLFIIQFWEVVIKFFAKLLKVGGDLTSISQDIVSVSFSAQVLNVVPIFGGTLSSIANFILMYVGLRSRLYSSPVLSVLILLSPFLILMFFVCVVLLMVVLFI